MIVQSNFIPKIFSSFMKVDAVTVYPFIFIARES